ncbi:cytochrome P450 monooxygenase sthF [Parastagonospora nodorum]|nr:cytochrome P450 monooxygenase sthF [Parastagonospora nodorum]KAH4054484.1 cytochrome P450 monooxygenase sthF [Parastagonospora nodorum]KAH4187291.1 cytochrome P450 monooxygenase sthF [Parastagonospora nodorum]KAH4305900.1 cytochrome P450 monooxygenase sthF [Parastagonospora nodorum]KAH4310938.1 cytochrome P450 monooxygenase sthF [Parastagonospora nodorum]
MGLQFLAPGEKVFPSLHRIIISTFALIAAYIFIVRPLRNILFHPLKKYPGPKLFGASSIPYGFYYMTGKWHLKIRNLHATYGPIVRIGPDELSYACPEAWEDIYGRYVPTKRRENPKPVWYCSPDAHDMVGASLGDHGRMRRVMAPGFTYSAMCKQEPLIKGHVDMFLSKLCSLCGDGRAEVNILDWLTYCTFDLIGDLSFGEPFGCMENNMLHPWLQLVFANIYITHIILLCQRIPFFYLFLPIKTTYQLWRDFRRHVVLLREVVERRLSLSTPRDDFLDVMTTKQTSTLYMTKEEIFKNAILLTGGGAETTSSSLSGMMYMLTMRPDVKEKILEELRDTFPSEDDINMRSVAQLTYTGAFIEESMRYYPPGPNTMWRITPPAGNTILGDYIPGNTIVGIPHRVLYRSEAYWKDADGFRPERWLPDGQRPAEFDEDKREGFHPFSYGPRACIAMNLAYAEMRYILARFLWHFDIEATKESKKWMDDQKAYLVWDKPGLFVHLKPRAGVKVAA